MTFDDEPRTLEEMDARYRAARARMKRVPAQPVAAPPDGPAPQSLAPVTPLPVAAEPENEPEIDDPDTLDFTRQDHRLARHSLPVYLAKIIKIGVATQYKLTLADIESEQRTARIVAARHEAIALISAALPHWSLPRIGRALGGRDHTTVLHALKRVGCWPRR